MNKGARKFEPKKFDKPKNIFLKPENIFIDAVYAFNHNPEAQPKIGKLNSVKEWFDTMELLFTKVCNHSKFKLNVEISSTGRYHFHGYISVVDIIGFYTKDVKSLIQSGTSIMKVIDKESDWEEYIWKQKGFIQPHLQAELFGALVITIKDININSLG